MRASASFSHLELGFPRSFGGWGGGGVLALRKITESLDPFTVLQLEDRSAARGHFDTFWASANRSFKCAASCVRRCTSFSRWLRSLMCARCEAARLCFNDALTQSLRGGEVTDS